MSESTGATSYSLHEAAASGDIDTLNRLLEAGADVDECDDMGRTPLFRAAREGELIAVRHLLKRNARVEKTAGATTALMLAARGGHTEIVRLLLAKGADPNQMIYPRPYVPNTEAEEAGRKLRERVGLSEETAEEVAARRRKAEAPCRANTLTRAIMSRNLDTVVVLLEAGAEVNEGQEKTGMSPLHLGVSFGDADIVRALIRHGASLQGANADAMTVLGVAVMQGKIEVARVLLEAGADPNSGGSMPPLVFAIQFDNIEMINLLLEFGASLEPDAKGMSMPAVMARDKPEIMELFARHQGNDWHALVESGDLNAVRARLDAGAGIEVRSGSTQKTALMLAAELGYAPIVNLLLTRGAQIEARDQFELTPLMFAARKGHEEALRILIAYHADVNATNQWGQTAFSMVTSDERRAVREMLAAAGATVGMVECALTDDVAKVMSFLAEGTPVDHANSGGMTVSMAAAIRGNLELLTLFHERGASLSLRDRHENTAFHYSVQAACKTGDTGILARLIEWGAEINAPGSFGSSPLVTAVVSASEPVMRFLLENGADANHSEGGIGASLIHTAIILAGKSLRPLEILLEFGEDIEGRDSADQTPLMQALSLTPEIMGGDGDGAKKIRSIVRFLIDRGANINAKGKYQTVLQLGVRSGDTEIVRMLLDAGADGKTGMPRLGFFTGLGKQTPEIAALLRDRGVTGSSLEDAALDSAPGFVQKAIDGAPVLLDFPKMLDEINERRRQKKSGKDETAALGE